MLEVTNLVRRASRRQALIIGLVTAVLLALPAAAAATHAWGTYHWARSSNPISLQVVDNVTATWDGHLDVARGDWSQSSVLDLVEAAGAGTNGKTCKAINGKINACNGLYGNTGWLGVAQIWVRGSHITRATTRVNDTYFNSAPYNTSEWRQFVMCQEIGHDFGLDHQDEDFDNANLGTCMDYTDSPNSNQHPNQHDYDQLELIYAHVDSGASGPASVPGNGQRDPRAPAAWGRAVDDDVYVADVGGGMRVITFVIWVR
ncbi:MAG TPA: hypothetical protein VGA91_00420 [Candidatus Limnocylindria bacterium]